MCLDIPEHDGAGLPASVCERPEAVHAGVQHKRPRDWRGNGRDIQLSFAGYHLAQGGFPFGKVHRTVPV